MGKHSRALRWAIDTYRYQRNKPHGSRAGRYHAAMLALQGAHLIAGQRWWWANPSYWLIAIGRRAFETPPVEEG